MTDRATYLFALPTFLSGAASLFDFAGSLNTYNTCETGEEADALAMYVDFAAVRDELREAIAASSPG